MKGGGQGVRRRLRENELENQMSAIGDMLEKWRFTYGYKRGLLGGLKAVSGWKWPTKGELRRLTGMDEDEFESALRDAADDMEVEVRNGRVGLTSAPMDVGTGKYNYGGY